jgi:hypothetical protein
MARVQVSGALVGLLLLQVSAPTPAAENDVQVPFIFSEDEKLPQTSFDEIAPRTAELATDPFLNAPLTRLEYLLMMLELRLNEEEQKRYLISELAPAFERRDAPAPSNFKVVGFARHDRKNGRLVVGYKVGELGRPRRPMRMTCDAFLSELMSIAPQGDIGFLYHNTILGVLSQRDHAEYTSVLQLFARSVVHRVVLESVTEKTRVWHILSCQRSGDGARIVYLRSSFKLR